MGEVYRARDTRLGREVAVKILNSQDRDRLRRFELEARAAYLRLDPRLAPLRSDPRYTDLVRRLGFPS
jgi:serine/threonine protein kinase